MSNVFSSKTLVFLTVIKVKMIITFIQTKNKPRHSIYHSKFSKYLKFHKNPFQGHRNWDPKPLNFYNGNACQGAPKLHGKFYKISHIY